MSSIGRNPNWDSIILRTLSNSWSKWSKTGKISKQIRYNFFSKNSSKFPTTCYGQFATVSLQPSGYVLHASFMFYILHPVQVLSSTSTSSWTAVFSTKTVFYRYFLLFSGYTYFSCCDSIAILLVLVPQFLLVPTITCVQSDHVRNHQQKCKNQKSPE